MTQLTIPNVPTEVEYAVIVSSTGPFTVPFPFFDEDDVFAEVTDANGTITSLVHSTDFTFTTLDVPAGQEGSGYEGGAITLNSAIGADGNTTLRIYRSTVVDRTANYPNTGPFSMALLNDEQNKQTMIQQEYSAENDAIDERIDDLEVDIAQNASDITTNETGILSNTNLINSLVLNPALSPMTLGDVRRFGMLTTNTGTQNHAALVTAIAAGIPLDFMEVYPILRVSTIVVPDNSDLHWYSSNKKGGLAFEERTVPAPEHVLREGLIGVHIMGTILIENLHISSPAGDVNSLISGPLFTVLPEGGTQYVEEMIVRNCSWEGRIQVCYFRGEQTTDPTVAWFGIRRFVFENNWAKNINAQLIGLRHIPHDLISMQNNRFHNMSCEILFSSISNGTANQEEVYEEKRLCVIKDNEWTTDDDFWSVEDVSTYLTFVVYEGREIVTTNNTMSGVKTVETQLNVYLTYSSALHVTESDNVYINNANLARATARNTLMKSKSIPEPVGSNRVGTRTYQNNQYIIEEEWLTAIGKVEADCCHALTELPAGLFPTVDTITDNVFRLMSIEGMGANDATHQSYSFRFDRNQINAQFWKPYIVANQNNSMVSFNQGIATDETIFSVCDNNVMIENTLDRLGSSFIEAGLHAGCFVMKNNYVKVPTAVGFDCNWLIKTGSHKPNVIMDDNIFEADHSTLGIVSTRTNFGKSIINENSLMTTDGSSAMTHRLPNFGRGSNVKMQMQGDMALEFGFPEGLYQDVDLNSLYDLEYGGAAESHTVIARIFRQVGTDWQEIEFTYDWGWNATDSDHRIQFTGTDGAAEDLSVTGSVGLNTQCRITRIGGNSVSLMTSISFKNDGTNRNWRVFPDNPGDGILRVELRVH